MNGLWRAAYWSCAVAVWVLSRPFRGVLHVALPRETALDQLVRDGLHGGRIHAALAQRLAIEVEDPGADEVGEELAVGLDLRVRALAADDARVVAEAEVRDPVVLRDEGALGGQGLRQVGGGGVRGERHVCVLVFQEQDEDVADPRRRGRGRLRRYGEREQGKQCGEQQASSHDSAFCRESGLRKI
jgi:hypothetical protein